MSIYAYHDGLTFGDKLFVLTQLRLCRKVVGLRQPDLEPEIAGDLVAFLDHFRAKAKAIDYELQAQIRKSPVTAAAWHRGARVQYLHRVWSLVREMIDDMAQHLPPQSNALEVARQSVDRAVAHLVFPAEHPEDTEFRRDIVAIYGSLVEAVRQARGWTERDDGRPGLVRDVEVQCHA